MKKLFLCLVVLAFSATMGLAQDRPTRTLYNNRVPYKALFQNFNQNQIKVQVNTQRGKVQAEVPVVNDAEKDMTQKKGK